MMIVREQKMDHRVRVTHTLLKEALYKLIQTKSVQDITVKELCYEANINRTTFYAHFQSVKNLIESLESEVWVELIVLIKKSEKDNRYFSNQIFHDVYQLANHYHELFDLLLIKNADPEFVEKVYKLGRTAFKVSFDKSLVGKKASSMEYYYISVLNSFIGIMKLWFVENRKETPEQMADITKGIINRGIQYILIET